MSREIDTTATHSPREDQLLHGLLAEFQTVDEIMAAARGVQANGYTRWDSFSPFPIHGMDRVMQAKATRLPWIVLICGLMGLVGGIVICWWTNSTTFPVPYALRGYPYIISGKPLFSLPANIPVIFETTVLLAGIGAAVGMLILNGLPRLYNPLFRSRRFCRVTQDRFFIAIESTDPRFDRRQTANLLLDLGAAHVEEVVD